MHVLNSDFTPKFKIDSSDQLKHLTIHQLKQNRSTRENDRNALRWMESFEILSRIQTERREQKVNKFEKE